MPLPRQRRRRPAPSTTERESKEKKEKKRQPVLAIVYTDSHTSTNIIEIMNTCVYLPLGVYKCGLGCAAVAALVRARALSRSLTFARSLLLPPPPLCPSSLSLSLCTDALASTP